MLTKFLYTKLLMWGGVRVYDPKELRFLESGLIYKSYLRYKWSYLFK